MHTVYNGTMETGTFAIIGPGRLGTSLFRALSDAGWICTAIRARTQQSLARARAALPGQWTGDTWHQPERWPTTGLILVTVADREIERVGLRLGEEEAPWAPVVLHTSGLRPSTDLEPCRRRGMAAGSWHPLQTFPKPGMPPEVFKGALCAVEGDPPAVAAGTELARFLGMHPWPIEPAAKPLYHAAAAIAANLTHILIVEAKRHMIEAGFPPDAVGPALAPMVHASIDAALNARGFEALTGPSARGDVATAAAHRAALPPAAAEAYAAVARLIQPPSDGPAT